MATPSGDRDSDHLRERVCTLFAALLMHFATPNLQGVQTAFPRGRGVPGYSLVGNNDGDGIRRDFDDALASPSGDLWIPPNIDPEGQYSVVLVDQLPAIQDPVENVDANNAAAAEADLEMWLAVAEVASLPRQIERDEANMMVRCPLVSSSVAESGVAPSSLMDDVATGVVAAPQHLPPQSLVPETVAADAPAPDVVGILAGVLPQRIEDEEKADAEAQVEMEVAIEAVPPGMLELISRSDAARLLQFATASMAVPAGGLESNLEKRMPVENPEAGDSSADLQAEISVQDDVENLEVEEPHTNGTQ